VKKMISIIFLFAIMLLSACSGQEKGELTRVDVLIENQGEIHIQDKDTLVEIENIFEQIKWDDKVVNMAREADVKTIFFYTFDENMPERLVEYEIWFNENADTATIVSDNENQSYGELDKDNTNTLRKILLK
jgi:lipocalin